jgi:hypothetical protein
MPSIGGLLKEVNPAENESDYKMDLRYAPIWGQTAICLPDEVQKTIVDNNGTL